MLEGKGSLSLEMGGVSVLKLQICQVPLYQYWFYLNYTLLYIYSPIISIGDFQALFFHMKHFFSLIKEQVLP